MTIRQVDFIHSLVAGKLVGSHRDSTGEKRQIKRAVAVAGGQGWEVMSSEVTIMSERAAQERAKKSSEKTEGVWKSNIPGKTTPFYFFLLPGLKTHRFPHVLR